MRTLILLACLFGTATAVAQTCGGAITAESLVCSTVTGQTVSFDPRFVLAQSEKNFFLRKHV